jgi:hypothetical protein
MGSVQTFKPTPSLITIPENYPNDPTPGKIEILWGANTKSLYHRLSPFVDYNTNFIGGFTTQPYYYTYIDEKGKGLAGLRKYESRIFPIGSAPIDVIRVAKFMASGNGIIFLGKQFLLQTGNPYNETRIYNPTSPLVAAGMGITLGAMRPMRHIDTSSGLFGILSSLVGSSIPSLFMEPKNNPPSGTTGLDALSTTMKTRGGKGLIRAGTANRAKSHLEAAWVNPGEQRKSFGSIVKGLVTSLFANFIPAKQDGITNKSDEGTYGLMIGAGRAKFGDEDNTDAFGFHQRWFGGSATIRKKGEDNKDNAGLLYRTPDGTVKLFKDRSWSKYLTGIGRIGYSIDNSHFRDGIRYGESFGKDPDYEASDIMKVWSEYWYDKNEYPTKKTSKNDKDSLTQGINTTLTKVIDSIKAASDKLYTVNVPEDATVIRSGKSTVMGYDRLSQTNKKGVSALQYPLGVLKDYRTVTVVDESLNQGSQRSYKLPTAGRYDSINTLTVLPAKAVVNETEWKKLNLRGWEKPWDAYKDDLIAFLFYDVVNENYIPFRATTKGLVESGNASWEELPFIGRGDKIYSYGGFNRNVTFSFKIVISSIAELAPTWQRINYLTTLIKPANYTTEKYNRITNRFMVPPMVLLTIGDMYKFQPVLIQSVTTTIPDDASWETLNEENTLGDNQWNYLASYIKSPNVLYGQLPREVEIGINMIILEKERAIVGGINFGNSDNDFQRSLLVKVDKAVPVSPYTPDTSFPERRPAPDLDIPYGVLPQQTLPYRPNDQILDYEPGPGPAPSISSPPPYYGPNIGV